MPKVLLAVGLLLVLLAGIVGYSKESSVAQRRTDAGQFDDRMQSFSRALGTAPFRTAGAVRDADHSITYFLAGSGVACLVAGLAMLGIVRQPPVD